MTTKKGASQGRQRNHTGSITARKDAEGRVIRYQGAFRHEGTRYTVYAPTYTACDTKMKTKMREVETGTAVPLDKVTVSKWMKEWLNEVKGVNVRAGSFEVYSSIIDSWIDPLIGNAQVQKLTMHLIQTKFVNKMRTSGRLCPSSIVHGYGILHGGLEYAVKAGILKKNPCEGVELPQVEDTERPILNKEHMDALRARLKGHWLGPVVDLALATGMRIGEILALHWKHVDFEQGVLYVKHSVSRVKGKGLVLGPPKTARSDRRIKLGPTALKKLKAHRVAQAEARLKAGPGWQDLDLVFPNSKGGYIDARVVAKVIAGAVTALSLPQGFTFHCLRHTCVALLIRKGAQPKLIQELLGHSSIQITMDRYGHLWPGMHDDAMEGLDAVLEA